MNCRFPQSWGGVRMVGGVRRNLQGEGRFLAESRERGKQRELVGRAWQLLPAQRQGH